MQENSNSRNKKLLAALLAGLIGITLFKISGAVVEKLLPDADSVVIELICDIICSVIAVIMVIVTKKTKIFGAEKGSFKKGLGAGLFLIIEPALIMLFSLPTLIGKQLKPAHLIAFFVLDMLLTGVNEELVYRGVVLDFAHEAFGSDTKKGAYATAAFSGAIFGIVHLTNLLNSNVPSAVVFQVIGAVGGGFFFGALYLRCRNIYALIFLHAFNDFCGMVKVGIFAGSELREAIDSHGAGVFLSAALLTGIGVYLLRSGKMNYRTEEPAAA